MIFMPIFVNAQTWQYTGAMNSTRWLSEMVVLDNQTALIVGGYDGNGRVQSTCEIYDPATASWSSTGSMNIARAYPILIKLPNGHVLSMCGGISSTGSGDATAVVEDYDPLNGTWTTAGQLITPRFVPSAILLSNGQVLVAGGLTSNGTTASCELYDPNTKTSTLTGSMLLNRYCMQAVLMADGKVILTGGRDGGASSNYFGECELYDPASGTWSVTSSMKQARTMGVFARFSDNTVLAAGGRNTPEGLATGSEILDPVTNDWQVTASIKEPIHWTAGIGFPDDRFMATGGIVDGQFFDPSGLSVVTTSKCEWYDRNLQQWYFAPELNYSRCRHNAVYLHQTLNIDMPTDFLLVAGGQKGEGTLDSSGFHAHSEEFTNTAEILDVTQPALKAYMKMPVNEGTAGVRTTSENNNYFFAYYMPDGSIKVNYLLASNDNVKLELMSVDGRTSKRIMNSSVSSGTYSIAVATNDLTPGVYFMHYSTSLTDRIFKFIVSR